MEREQIEDMLDEYMNAVGSRVRAQIDAGACRTESDFRRMHRAQEREEEVREKIVEKLTKALVKVGV